MKRALPLLFLLVSLSSAQMHGYNITHQPAQDSILHPGDSLKIAWIDSFACQIVRLSWCNGSCSYGGTNSYTFTPYWDIHLNNYRHPFFKHNDTMFFSTKLYDTMLDNSGNSVVIASDSCRVYLSYRKDRGCPFYNVISVPQYYTPYFSIRPVTSVRFSPRSGRAIQDRVPLALYDLRGRLLKRFYNGVNGNQASTDLLAGYRPGSYIVQYSGSAGYFTICK